MDRSAVRDLERGLRSYPLRVFDLLVTGKRCKHGLLPQSRLRVHEFDAVVRARLESVRGRVQ